MAAIDPETCNPSFDILANYTAGGDGGHAMRLGCKTIITGNGLIQCGYGGGGGAWASSDSNPGGGGGGGAGYGSGGAGGVRDGFTFDACSIPEIQAVSGSNGTQNGGGSGGDGSADGGRGGSPAAAATRGGNSGGLPGSNGKGIIKQGHSLSYSGITLRGGHS